MMLPRLPILELESQANRSDDIPKESLTDFEKLMNKFENLIISNKSQTFNKNEDLKDLTILKENFQKIKDQTINLKTKYTKKRIAFQGLSEVYSMVSDGSSVFQDIQFPSKYFNTGGDKIADSLIRMEIAKNIGKLN